MDHPAEMLRLAGIKPGMRVADVLAGDGYYSELAYVVGPKGRVLMINNTAFDHWSDGPLQARLAGTRLANVEHQTLDLNHLGLAPASLTICTGWMPRASGPRTIPQGELIGRGGS